jgi:hypothetical protein
MHDVFCSFYSAICYLLVVCVFCYIVVAAFLCVNDNILYINVLVSVISVMDFSSVFFCIFSSTTREFSNMSLCIQLSHFFVST